MAGEACTEICDISHVVPSAQVYASADPEPHGLPSMRIIPADNGPHHLPDGFSKDSWMC